MQQFHLSAPALPLVFATTGHETAHPLQTERSAKCSAEVVELDGVENVVAADASSGADLCLEESPSPEYGDGEPRVLKPRKQCSRKEETIVVDDIDWKKRENS